MESSSSTRATLGHWRRLSRRCSRHARRVHHWLVFILLSLATTSVHGFIVPATSVLSKPPLSQQQGVVSLGTRSSSLFAAAALNIPAMTSSSSSSSLMQSLSSVLWTKASLDIIGVTTGFAILVLYHARLYHKERQGSRTWRSAQADTRAQWAQFVRETQGWLYAIQTLRNAITAQTFLATTVLSLLTVITGRLWEIIRTTGGAATANQERQYLLVTQFVMIAGCMLTSAYHFLQSARLMTHAGFMFPVMPQKTKVDRIMRKSQNAQWLGLRWLYLSAAMIAWVVGGPLVFGIFAVFLSVFFSKIDQVPQEIDDDHTYQI